VSLGASAGPKEDVAAAVASGATALGEGVPEKVLPLFSDDAVLWGTLSPVVRADRAALKDYFIEAFKVLPGLKVTFGEPFQRPPRQTPTLDLSSRHHAQRRRLRTVLTVHRSRFAGD
jgi:hypothetical protein